jgi:hypothetical protein
MECGIRTMLGAVAIISFTQLIFRWFVLLRNNFVASSSSSSSSIYIEVPSLRSGSVLSRRKSCSLRSR